MKKITLIIFILMALLVSGVGLASTSNSLDKYGSYDGYMMQPEKDGKYTEPRSDVGTRQIYNVYVSTTYYNQKDSQWKDDIMQKCEKTIGAVGCALTSTTMSFRAYNIPRTPKTFNTAMGDSACPFVWEDAPVKAGYTAVYLDTLRFNASREYFYNTALNALLDGVPVVVGFTQSNGNPHYVLVNYLYGTGYNLSDYWVLDPDRTSQLIRFDTLVGDRALRTVAVYPPTT